MTDQHLIKFIDSEFQADEACELLLSLLAHKIKYHELKNLGFKESTGQDNAFSLQRIEELKGSRLRLVHFIQNLAAHQDSIHIEAHIQLNIQNPKNNLKH